MKLLIKLSFTALLSIAFIASAKAQTSDYIIDNHNDTVWCSVKSLRGKLNYKPLNSTNNKYIEITTRNVKEFHTAKHNRTFRKIYEDGLWPSTDFLKVVERGTISLYEETTYYNDNSTDHWYVSKNSDTATLLKTSGLSIYIKSRKKRKNELAEMLKDKPLVYNEFIKHQRFGWPAVQKIVRLYNTTKDSSGSAGR